MPFLVYQVPVVPPVSQNEAEARFIVPGHLPAAALLAARQGDAQVRANQFGDAARFYAQAAEAAPQNPTLRLILGVALSAGRRTDLALEQFRRAVRLDDNDVVANLLLQAALAQKGQGTEASEVGQEVYRRFSRKDRRNGLNASGAIARFSAALRQQPDSPVLFLLLGDAYQLSEEWEKADDAYAQARRRAPLWAKPLVNGGLSLLAQGKTDLAIKAFSEALRRDPADVQAQTWKGEAELRAGRNQAAITTLQQVASARSVAPNLRAQASTSLGYAFANVQRFSAAENALNQAQQLAPTDPAAAAALGGVKLQTGDYTGAARAYDTALSLTRAGGLFAARPMLLRALAEAQLSSGQPQAAGETLKRALAEEPGNAPLWYRLSAQSLFDQGRDDEALVTLCAALDAEPDRYPLDTLNAMAARGLINRVGDRYQRDLEVARTGFSASEKGGRIAIVNTFSGGGGIAPSAAAAAPAPSAALKATARPISLSSEKQIRALVALASLARYNNKSEEEITLRRDLTVLRGSASDWYQYAEACDLRAAQPRAARDAYLKALETAEKSGGLTETQKTWSRARLDKLTPPAFKP